MSYWRKFILVVLLALCVPIQSFAAVSTQCAGAAVPHAGADASAAWQAMPSVHGERHRHGEHARDATRCSACGSCCFGSGIAQVPAVPVTSDGGRAIVSSVPSVVAVSFLTGGIDRPPRRNPV
ncbi:hypothetical protein [Burkholderia territorii]|uniref:hypothetical protein n=1 Tax=Burkholderia territorii TaxID=1503055 RepID=UPI0007528BC8|nr:hypothetical protein [Burkholderia territorii]KVQ61925.1 hypothetical protein WT22_14975 [Burkholderia territorii]KVQ68958.1 hypothetical protein WT23_06240 [Burkholderia territorii]KWA21428.1 hypothetical protein WT37_09135 [Burkholderia territorii]KWA33778.1 hypothetical protein WT40_14730 [Burkholderia territorii]KWO55558.1 hypothetical protein WT98_07195 [Burkholderia territorii]